MRKMFKFAKKGFTLIELLVVIAVLGILASVVLVAINPSERIKEANDSGVKNDVGQVATAVESYYTTNSGSYSGLTMSTLVSQGFLKQQVSDVTLDVGTYQTIVYGELDAKSTGCTSTGYWTYYSGDGQTYLCCDTAPSVGTAGAFVFADSEDSPGGGTSCTAQ